MIPEIKMTRVFYVDFFSFSFFAVIVEKIMGEDKIFYSGADPGEGLRGLQPPL